MGTLHESYLNKIKKFTLHNKIGKFIPEN